MHQTLPSGTIISSQARLGQNNQIGNHVTIEDDVVLGDNNTIMNGVIIKSGTRIGDYNHFHEYTIIGGSPQHLSFDVQTITHVEIGNHNTLREHVTVNRSTDPQQATRIGNHNYLMNHCHVAHDCKLNNNVTMAPSAALGGHVHVDDRAFISGGVMVHQFVHVGSLAMIGGNSKITQNVLPMMITDGNPAYLRGLNIVGLKRNGYTADDIYTLKKIYRIINQSALSFEDTLTQLRTLQTSLGNIYADFIASSKRGFHRKS